VPQAQEASAITFIQETGKLLIQWTIIECLYATQTTSCLGYPNGYIIPWELPLVEVQQFAILNLHLRRCRPNSWSFCAEIHSLQANGRGSVVGFDSEMQNARPTNGSTSVFRLRSNWVERCRRLNS